MFSYPDPGDLVPIDRQPVKLKGGYWLDKRGMGRHIAFLKMTYKQYAALKSAHTPEELKGMVLDADSLKELCDCGSKYSFKNTKQELNKLIVAKKIRTRCKVIR